MSARLQLLAFLTLALFVLSYRFQWSPLLFRHDIDSSDPRKLQEKQAEAEAQQASFPNGRLRNAYLALQAWKRAIFSDPSNFTANWIGPNVCNYNGIFCTAALDNPAIQVVAGIDLNHADVAGYLPPELGLLTDIALFHINSNRFCGILPHTFQNLRLLFELDISNNRFIGPFPRVLLSLPTLKYLDIRFNDFEGALPTELFDKDLDAVFVNNNKFDFTIPDNLGNSPVSVLVLANNRLRGCLSPTIGNMADTLNEIILLNNNLRGCLPATIGRLNNLTVFDISFNEFSGPLPGSLGNMIALQQLDVAHNMLTGAIPQSVCGLPNLQNFTYSFNYFTGEPPNCLALPARGTVADDSENCIAGRPSQRPPRECAKFLSRPVSCASFGCKTAPSIPPASPFLPPPTPQRPRSPTASPPKPSPPVSVPSFRPPPPPSSSHHSSKAPPPSASHHHLSPPPSYRRPLLPPPSNTPPNDASPPQGQRGMPWTPPYKGGHVPAPRHRYPPTPAVSLPPKLGFPYKSPPPPPFGY